MRLSPPAVAFLNTWLMEAADQVVVGDGYVNVLDATTAEEIRAQLQAWRDGLSVESRPISRELVEEAAASLARLPSIAVLASTYANDAELGAAVRELALAAGPNAARAHLLLQEALSP